EILRIHTDDTWDTLVGPGGSLSGYDSGFGHWPNTYVWWMQEHDGWLYASTYDMVSSLTWLLENIPEVLSEVLGNLKRDPHLLDAMFNAGSDIYKTQDGVTWYQVTDNGFGNIGNYGFRTMQSVGDTLYLGTANPFDGLEVWKSRPGSE
ncbi:MAG: hypothetical protein GY851_32850, partial [bacterium]|nr:hypothetical protein [bacterium]